MLTDESRSLVPLTLVTQSVVGGSSPPASRLLFRFLFRFELLLVSLLVFLLPLQPLPSHAAVGVALAVEQLNDDDRRCRLSDDGVRAAAEAGLHDRSVELAETRSPYLFYLEAGGMPSGERCAYTLIVRLMHVERLVTPHPLFGDARATLICSDGLRGLDQPGAGIDRVLAGLTRMVSNCLALIAGPLERSEHQRKREEADRRERGPDGAEPTEPRRSDARRA